MFRPYVSTSLEEVADYSNLGVGAAGEQKIDTANGQIWEYNETLSLWMPIGVQPTSLDINYDGSEVPAGATFGAASWGVSGTEGTAAADGVLTVTDDGASYALLTGTHANIANTNNVGAIARIKIDAENTTASGYKAMLALRPSNEKGGALTMAGGADGLSGEGQIYPFTTAAGGSLTGVPTYSADNNEYQIYYIFWNKTNKKYTMGVLGDAGTTYILDTAVFTTNYLTAFSVAFGAFSGGGQVTMLIDYVKTFTF